MSASKRRYDFLITIEMESGGVNTDYNYTMPYKLSQKYSDSLRISGRMVNISGSRVSKLNVREVINNHNSEINNQIIKSLCYYFCINKVICKIKNLRIKNHANECISYSSSELNQLTKKNISNDFLNNLNIESLSVILDSSPKGRAYYYALTHLMRALVIENEYDSFEKVWKSFNGIYKEITKKTSDHSCLRDMRKYILDNSANLPLSMTYCGKLTMEQIRKYMTWNQMILNDYPTIGKTEAYKDFILRYTDKRIMGIAQSSTIRNEFLTQESFLTTVNRHIADNADTINDAEVVSILCIKYMYYLRNKSIHGEHIDAGFRISPNNIPSENIKWCKNILLLLLCDLFNNN
ncbi:TPA: hypothetical protein MYL59_004879 [Klebsiella variicola subsp. variicola]|nr:MULTISPECIES: hypothetical protein [Klebsiella]HCB0628651.1 hypothetical protein [Klebsiella variicola subsp. variicola]HDU4714814.1 hypothetical protein [Klebsiella aerogenes]MBD0721875.1 hypothetical protein [Klebsiella variicola]MBR8848217.1 hypothetical protein [Klebsiella variicola]SWX70739.1 Uncharacterised protein [Klebsiella pneumoniae]